MKKFIARALCLFYIPVALLSVVQEITFRNIPNDYSYKNKWLTDHANEVQVLSLGSSHGFFGIIPSVFSKHAFNAAHVSQSLNFDTFIFDKFIGKMSNLEYLILPIDYFSLRSPGIENGQESWRTKYYTIYYDCPYFRWNPKFSLESYHLNVRETVDALINKPNHVSCDSLGYGYMYSYINRDSCWMESGSAACIRHSHSQWDIESVRKNVNSVLHIISTCKKRGIKVILLTTPAYHTYYDLLDEEQLSQVTRFCSEMANRYNNTIYLNWLKHPSFNEHDFFDADHLNDFGAEKLSMLLNDVIKSFQVI